MKQELIAGLIFDEAIYPRHAIDETLVARIGEAFLAGEKLPPIVACRDTKKLVDGVHRWRWLVRTYGDEAKWYVKWETFANDGERFKRSVALNARHGMALSKYDRAHCLVIGQRLGLADGELANALGIRESALESATRNRFAAGSAANVLKSPPLKRTIRHMAGKPMNDRQWEANDKLQGWPAWFYAEQLIELIEADLLNKDDERSVAALQKLAGLLEVAVAV